MKSKNFEDTTRIVILNDFKRRLKYLRDSYAQVQRQFNELCDELDAKSINEEYLHEITTHLTVHLSEMDLIAKKINEISEIIENIKLEMSN
jgi:hypothetical protein